VATSELVRDLDLAVGAASIWPDDLQGPAAMRLVVLDELIARAHRQRALRVEPPFLVITADGTTHRIHVGTGELTDAAGVTIRYKAPSRSHDQLVTANPMPGDRTLNRILAIAAAMTTTE